MNKSQPSKLRYFKHHKGGKVKAFKGIARYSIPKKCEFGIQVLKPGVVSAAQMKAAFEKARLLSRKETNFERIIMSVFPSHAYAQKATGQRMGSGKGPTGYYGINCKVGQILMEMDGKPEFVMNILRKAQAYFPMKTAIVTRRVV